MHHADVAGVEPSAAKRRRGGLRVAEVALHHVVAAHHDLALGLAVARHVVVVRVDHAHRVGHDHRNALAREQRRALGRRAILPPTCGWQTVYGP